MKKLILLIMCVLMANFVFSANVTIDDLPELTDGNVAAGDEIEVFDVSASVGSRSKKILMSSLRTYAFGSGFTLNGKLTGGSNEIEGSNFDITGGTISGLTSLTTTGAVGVKTASPSTDFDVTGDAYVSGTLYSQTQLDMLGSGSVFNQLRHYNDTDTYIDFRGSNSDRIDLFCGNINMISFEESTIDITTVNPTGADVDFRIETNVSPNTVYIDGATGNFGIESPNAPTKFDVHHDPTGLADATGGGDVVTFGTEDVTDTLDPGMIFYLNTSGIWKYADASDETTSGYVLLAIALGTDVSDGMLLRGYYRTDTYLTSFGKGRMMYISAGAPGYITSTKSAASGVCNRCIGYATDATNVIYFNPSGSYEVIP